MIQRPAILLLAALLVSTAGMCLLSHSVGATPVPPAKQPLSLEALSRRAHSKDDAVRELAVGLLLPHLKPGMTRNQVEKLIGPPHAPVDVKIAEMEATEDVIYYTRQAGMPGFQLMSVRYDTRKRPWRFVKVIGPHKREDCG